MIEYRNFKKEQTKQGLLDDEFSESVEVQGGHIMATMSLATRKNALQVRSIIQGFIKKRR